MKQPKQRKIKLKRGRIFNFFKGIFKKFKKKPEIIYLGEDEIDDKAIFISNHSAASGPMTFELFFPKNIAFWGTHEMFGNYKTRWKYLYHVFYQQKLHYSKFKSFFIATFFAIISKTMYKASAFIPTYKDTRLKETFRLSFDVLNENGGVLIFPENSSNGYLDIPMEYFRGFISLAKSYYKRTKQDVPIYNVYYSKEKNQIVIDTPEFVNKLLNQNMSEQTIAKHFLERAQNLFVNFIQKEASA